MVYHDARTRTKTKTASATALAVLVAATIVFSIVATAAIATADNAYAEKNKNGNGGETGRKSKADGAGDASDSNNSHNDGIDNSDHNRGIGGHEGHPHKVEAHKVRAEVRKKIDDKIGIHDHNAAVMAAPAVVAIGKGVAVAIGGDGVSGQTITYRTAIMASLVEKDDPATPEKEYSILHGRIVLFTSKPAEVVASTAAMPETAVQGRDIVAAYEFVPGSGTVKVSPIGLIWHASGQAKAVNGGTGVVEVNLTGYFSRHIDRDIAERMALSPSSLPMEGEERAGKINRGLGHDIKALLLWSADGSITPVSATATATATPSGPASGFELHYTVVSGHRHNNNDGNHRDSNSSHDNGGNDVASDGENNGRNEGGGEVIGAGASTGTVTEPARVGRGMIGTGQSNVPG